LLHFIFRFSSPFQENALPIHSFEFQTPIDDPRNFCYLWLLSGTSTAELSGGSLQLFGLEYENAEGTGSNIIYSVRTFHSQTTAETNILVLPAGFEELCSEMWI